MLWLVISIIWDAAYVVVLVVLVSVLVVWCGCVCVCVGGVTNPEISGVSAYFIISRFMLF